MSPLKKSALTINVETYPMYDSFFSSVYAHK